jgi:3',5'-cyclic-AMP phosphodiesterase
MNDWKENSDRFLSWVHFGDLHIQSAFDENYLDFLDLIDEANRHLVGKVNFAFLPGDNADDGARSQYALVSSALERLQIPFYVIAGDHDKKGGTLDSFREYLGVKEYYATTLNGFQLLFLNAMDGSRPEEFDFSTEQIEWLQEQLVKARSASLRPIVFTHLYPSELLTQAGAFTRLIREFQVELVEMGHTHYNELANDGHTIYATTRSTGQIEEGPPGFSITAIDGDVVSWKFKERKVWPFVMITAPADEKLITRPNSSSHVLRGTVSIRARAWGDAPVRAVMCSIDGATPQPMQFVQERWEIPWNSHEAPDGIHRLRVEAVTDDGHRAHDEISVLVNQAGDYEPPRRSAIDYENTIGAYPGKGILGTQLGPNENGTKGPWPSWRGQ